MDDEQTVAVGERPLRADARRNRDALLAAAVEAFARDGADVPLETIAAQAGVGVGTLYRNFPDRNALVEAAYRHEVEALCERVPAAARRARLGPRGTARAGRDGSSATPPPSRA